MPRKQPGADQRITIALLALLVAALIAIQVLTGNEDDHGGATSGGPLRLAPNHAWVIDYPVGTTFTDGMERLVNDGSEPVIIDRVELLGKDVPFKLVDALYAGIHRHVGVWQLDPQFPPAPDHPKRFGKLKPIEGAVVPVNSGQGLELILGLRVEKEGYGERTGVRIYYRVGDVKYVIDDPAGLVHCTPGGDTSACLDRYSRAHDLL